MAWAEVPPSRTARIVANVLVDEGDTADTVRARSVLLLHRHRNESEVEQFCAHRDDRLRRVDAELRIAERTIVLTGTALPGRNLALFF